MPFGGPGLAHGGHHLNTPVPYQLKGIMIFAHLYSVFPETCFASVKNILDTPF